MGGVYWGVKDEASHRCHNSLAAALSAWARASLRLRIRKWTTYSSLTRLSGLGLGFSSRLSWRADDEMQCGAGGGLACDGPPHLRGGCRVWPVWTAGCVSGSSPRLTQPPLACFLGRRMCPHVSAFKRSSLPAHDSTLSRSRHCCRIYTDGYTCLLPSQPSAPHACEE